MSENLQPELSIGEKFDVILDAVEKFVNKISVTIGESSSSSPARADDDRELLLESRDSTLKVNVSSTMDHLPHSSSDDFVHSKSGEMVTSGNEPSQLIPDHENGIKMKDPSSGDDFKRISRSQDLVLCDKSGISYPAKKIMSDDRPGSNESGIEINDSSSGHTFVTVRPSQDLISCKKSGVSFPVEETALVEQQPNHSASHSTETNSSPISSNTENRAVLVNSVSECSQLEKNAENNAFGSKRNIILSKLSKYYGTPLSKGVSSSSPGEYSINQERRFLLIGSCEPEPKSRKQLIESKDGTEVSPNMTPKRKSVSFKSKMSPSGQYSPGRFSPGNFSPSRRTSIMYPLTSSPSSLDERISSERYALNHDEFKLLDGPENKKLKIGSEEMSLETTMLRSALLNCSRPFETSSLTTVSSRSCPKKAQKKTKLKNTEYRCRPKKKRGSKNQDKSNSAPDEYDVEYLESHKVLENNQCVFLVKWVGWDSSDNSWEPISNLLNCQEKLVDYFEKLQKAGKHQEIEILLYNSALSQLRQTLSKASDEEMNRLLSTFHSNDCLKLPTPNKEFIEKTLNLLSKQRLDDVGEALKEKLRHELLLEKLWLKRNVQLNALKEWELEINFLAQNSALITVENNVDLEGPPPNFHYIDHYLPGAGVIIPNDPPFGCDCSGGCNEKSPNCCGKEFGFAYDHSGRIKVPRGTPIYECNSRCSCSEKCLNRVVQKGQHHRLCIFKTSNGCGWGVKSLENIKKGSFITKYVGEVITAPEAAVRARSETSRFYLFDLDFNQHNSNTCPFTVDASIYGNISHFINHSCDPNLAIYAAWINCLDPNIPLLVLFAVRDIQKGEELCFSYSRTDKRRKGTRAEIKCKCNASNCRKYVF